jgi:hypothetical protein
VVAKKAPNRKPLKVSQGAKLGAMVIAQDQRNAGSSPAHRIVETPDDKARHTFDAANNVEPCRIIAERIAAKYGAGPTHSMVDAISHAIEDARELGEKRRALQLSSNMKFTVT